MIHYEPLKTFLGARIANELGMTFGEIEALIGQSLPPEAFRHLHWWNNDPTNNAMTKAWLGAGYRTGGVDMVDRRLIFVRAAEDMPLAALSSPPAVGILARLHAPLASSVTIPAGIDLTEPSGEIWDAER